MCSIIIVTVLKPDNILIFVYIEVQREFNNMKINKYKGLNIIILDLKNIKCSSLSLIPM